MGYFGTLDYRTVASLYTRFCNDDGWKKGYAGIQQLIKCFEAKGGCGGWYEEYKKLDRAAEILCGLIPMVYYGETGNRQIKAYSRWREECGKIIQIIHEKALPWEIDQVEVKAAELVRNRINMISENSRYGKEVQACFKERYLEYLMEQSEKFFQASEKVYGILENAENEKDRAEIAKRAFDSLNIK